MGATRGKKKERQSLQKEKKSISRRRTKNPHPAHLKLIVPKRKGNNRSDERRRTTTVPTSEYYILSSRRKGCDALASSQEKREKTLSVTVGEKVKKKR